MKGRGSDDAPQLRQTNYREKETSVRVKQGLTIPTKNAEICHCNVSKTNTENTENKLLFQVSFSENGKRRENSIIVPAHRESWQTSGG